ARGLPVDRELKLSVPTYYGTVNCKRNVAGEDFDEPNVPVLIHEAEGVRIVLGTHDYNDVEKSDIPSPSPGRRCATSSNGRRAMPDEVFAWMRRVKAVEREYAMTRLALDRLRQQAMANPGVPTANQRYRDISTAADRLE